LKDDFYCNVIDWNQNNELGVALGSILYIWNSETGDANSIHEMTDES